MRARHQKTIAACATGARRGATTVEVAMILPVLFLFIFASFEFSRLNMLKHLAGAAAYEGAREGIVIGATADDVTTRVNAILALDSESGEEDMAAIRAIPGAMVEASIGRFAEYGQPLNDGDLTRFAEIVRMSGRPVIAPSQKRFTPGDMPRLKAAGIGAVLVGAVVTGLEPEGLRAAVAPIVEAAQRA